MEYFLEHSFFIFFKLLLKIFINKKQLTCQHLSWLSISPSSHKTMQMMVVEIVRLSLGTNSTPLSFFLEYSFLYFFHLCYKMFLDKNNTHAGTYLAFCTKENAGDGSALGSLVHWVRRTHKNPSQSSFWNILIFLITTQRQCWRWWCR